MALLEHKGFRKSDQTNLGSKFLLSNGYLGYRGTLDESDSSDFVALNLNGIFDGDLAYETLNAYNPLYIMIKADGINLNPKSFRPKKHKVSLDTDTGVFRRHTDFQYADVEISISSERFVDQIEKNLIYSKYMFKSNKPIEIELFSGIDTFIWNIFDIHLKDDVIEYKGNSQFVISKTKKNDIEVVVGLIDDFLFKAKNTTPDDSVSKYEMKLQSGVEYEVYKYAGVIYGEDKGREKLEEKLTAAKKIGYEELLKRNKLFWDKAFEFSRVNIFNNPVVKEQIDYAVFQLIAHRPFSDKVSIPHSGLSGQYNGGGVPWDSEIMILPFFINTDTILARYLVMYRIKSLKEAIIRAEENGYSGALYPALSGTKGIELEKRNTRNMVHINASIIYGLYHYVERTADYSVLFEGGLEMMLECARFYISYAALSENKKHYDFLKVRGLDFTHKYVDNEAYTNMMIKNCLDSVIKCVAFAKQTDKNEVKKIFDEKNYDDLIGEIRELRRRLYTKKENKEYMIESYDNYYNLPDLNVSTNKKANYIESTKKIDYINSTYAQESNVLAMLALFRDEFPLIVHRTNYDYYIRRSINPSYFSQVMYIIEACEVNQPDDAYDMFLKTADLSLTNDHLFSKGLNLSLLGGLYLCVIYGFAGVKHHTYLVEADYNSPTKIRRIEFKLRVADNIAYVKTKRNSVVVSWQEIEDDEEINLEEKIIKDNNI